MAETITIFFPCNSHTATSYSVQIQERNVTIKKQVNDKNYVAEE